MCPEPELGMFALECACNALDLYDEAFGQPYPLPKSDMVAIPEFAAGAMENWGLVTYREVDLLIDDATASSRQLQRVATSPGGPRLPTAHGVRMGGLPIGGGA